MLWLCTILTRCLCGCSAAHPGGKCVAWAWSQPKGGIVGSCNLKAGATCAQIHHKGTTSGLLAALPPPPPYRPPHPTPPGAHNVSISMLVSPF
jgi:hypothetical protein